jgi:hypothetical protein
MQASTNIQQAFNQFNKREAGSLYREAHDLLEQYHKTNDGTGLPSIHAGNFRRWLDKASAPVSKASTRLEQDKENIDQALNPKRYSPRKPALLAIQPFWKETDALYEAYGAA